MSWKLPASLNIGGADFTIRTDFRVILDIFEAMNDPDLPDWAKTQVMVKILYEKTIPDKYYEEAARKAVWFIDCGKEPEQNKKPKLIDWEQDSDLIVAGINKITGTLDIRSIPYMHWWTFMGYFNEIGDGALATIVNIRNKKAHGKKLEKWESEFYRENRKMIDFQTKLSEADQKRLEAERKALKELLG